MEKGTRFNYLKKIFQEEHRSELKEVLQENAKGPLLVEFDPTTACNYSCPECISADLLNQDKIPSERIDDLMDEFAKAGVKGVIFIGGGEPLAHTCMPKPIRKLFDLGIHVGLTTNGSLISKYENTISECVSWTRVSVDAGTETTYNNFRPTKIRDSFNKVILSMESLAKHKKGVLGFSFLVMTRPMNNSNSGEESKYFTNADEIYTAAKLAKEIGCDYFEFKPMVDNKHYLKSFNQRMRDLIQEQQYLCESLEDDEFEIITPKSIEFLYNEDNPVQPKDYSCCPAMDLRTLVTPSGIYPCPYHRGRQDKILGTVYDGPFDKWWPSESRKNAAKKIDPRVDCQFYCIRHQTNLVMDSFKKLHEQGIPILDYIENQENLNDPFF